VDREEALAIIDAADFDQLIGVSESEELEFKRSPYHLEEEWQVFELAKDASALANLRGGLLLIGFATEQSPDSPVERVTEVRLFGEQLLDQQQYRDLLRDRVYPRIGGLRLEWRASAQDRTRGIGVIDVPPQAERDKYFLIAHPFVGEQRARGWLVGLAQRAVDGVKPQTIAEVHGLISRGLGVGARLDEMAALLSRLDERTVAPAAQEAPPEAPSDRLAARIATGVNELNEILGAAPR
jgi:schlafen family protein